MGPIIIAIIGAVATITVALINNAHKHQDDDWDESGEWIIVEEEPEDEVELVVWEEEYLLEEPEGDVIFVAEEYVLY